MGLLVGAMDIATANNTVAIVIAIPLKSYHEYEDYLARLLEASKPEPKPVLESLSVQLKDGVNYFKNDLANPKASDFIVKANYTLDGESYSEDVPENKFDITVAPDFYAVGGDVKITYKGKTEVFTVELIPVKIETLSIAQNPYTVTYQIGATFDVNGLIINAVYNDGSTKVIPTEKYEVDTQTQLALASSSVTVGYTEGGETKTVEVPIRVVEVLDNGAVTKLILAGEENAVYYESKDYSEGLSSARKVSELQTTDSNGNIYDLYKTKARTS